jgi:plasmid stabilization system protein ParE
MARSKSYRLHPLAWLEIEGADDWYRQRSPQASRDFVAEVFNAIETIREAPHRWPEHLHGTRRLILERFPFSVVYFDAAEFVNIVAVAHNKRKLGYWKRRL